MYKRLLVLLLLSWNLGMYGSCNTPSDASKTTETSTSSSVPPQAKIEDITPSDAVLAEKYARSCVICHTNPDANAPLTHSAEWNTRIQEKGLDALVDHAINGFNAMPAMGQCLDCTREEMKALIVFMADQE